MEEIGENKIRVTIDVDVDKIRSDLIRNLSEQWNEETPESEEEIYNRAIKSAKYFIDTEVKKAIVEEAKKQFFENPELKEYLTTSIKNRIKETFFTEFLTGLMPYQLEKMIEKGYHNRIGEISPINIVFSEEERKEFLTEVRNKVKERIFSIVDNLSESEYSRLYDFLKMFVDIAIGKRG